MPKFQPVTQLDHDQNPNETVFVAAFPTRESLEKLQLIFTSSPLTIYWNALYVPLWAGPLKDAPDVDSSVVVARTKSFKILVDPLTQNTELAASLDSVALQNMLFEFGHDDDYPLRLTFQSFAPSLSQAKKFFISSVSDSLAFSPPTLRLQPRLVKLDTNATTPTLNSQTVLIG